MKNLELVEWNYSLYLLEEVSSNLLWSDENSWNIKTLTNILQNCNWKLWNLIRLAYWGSESSCTSQSITYFRNKDWRAIHLSQSWEMYYKQCSQEAKLHIIGWPTSRKEGVSDSSIWVCNCKKHTGKKITNTYQILNGTLLCVCKTTSKIMLMMMPIFQVMKEWKHNFSMSGPAQPAL